MLTKLVTLCLLITYHWHGSTADSTTLVRSVPGFVGAAAATVGIAGEVNGSPTDARLNIPVVKRSSNQAEFANELRHVIVERPMNVESSLPSTFFHVRHEYENSNEKKLTEKKLVDTEKLVEPPFAVVFESFGKRGKSWTGKITKLDREIKSSIVDKDPEKLVARRLIGKTNFPENGLNRERGFHYAGESMETESSKANDRRNVETTGNGDDERSKKRNEKFVEKNDEESNGEAVVGRVFVSDVSHLVERRIRRDVEARERRKEEDSSVLGVETIDNEFPERRKQERDNYDVGGMSLGSLVSLSSLKPLLRQRFEGSKLSVNGDFNNFVGSRRLHQQSRNTEPQTSIQHLRRNIKRHTTFDNDELSTISTLVGNENEKLFDNRNIANLRSSTKDHRDELRFVPLNRHRGDRNRIYFQRFLRPLSPLGAFRENSPGVGAFPSSDVIYPRKMSTFDDGRIVSLKNSIKGVFDNYETKQVLPANLFPNVRMIESEQIFVTPPRLIYDSKILPAPFSLDSYFPKPSNVNVNVNGDNNDSDGNGDDNGNRSIMMNQVVKGVFDQTREVTESDHRDVIPVMEETTLPSITNPRNFVTPSPDRGINVGDVFATSGNHPNVDTNVRNEIYRITEKLRIPESGVNNGGGGENVEDENSRMNDESVVEAGAEHRFVGNHGSDVRESSYDDETGTSDNHGQIGSTMVDHTSVIAGTTDEYVNPSPGIPRRNQSYVTSSDNAYDRGNYKWRDNDDRNRYAGNYSFGYRVSDQETENEFGHRETRKDGITTGQYHVRLPDGRLQKVNYHVDDGGYHASVAYHYNNNDE